MTIYDRLRDELQTALDKSGKSKAAVAATAGLKPHTVTDVFAGRGNPTVATLQAIADAIATKDRSARTRRLPPI